MDGPFGPEATVGDALAHMTRAFSDAGIDEPSRDARFLLQGLLGIDPVDMLTRPDRRLGAAAERVGDGLRRRLKHEPVSRIVGKRAFYGRDFIVTPDVLDPRADTETVVDLALDLVRERGLADRPLRIADIGTGSGILIATLLAELPRAQGIATDFSEAALAVAKQNAARLGVGDRATFIATHGLRGCEGRLDLVVSNPPYVATGEIPALDAEVRDFDPRLALDGGTDGLQVYREIAGDIAKMHLSPLFVLEVGARQALEVEKIFEAANGVPLARRADLGGHVRAVALEIHW